jgi:hypothetical protein
MGGYIGGRRPVAKPRSGWKFAILNDAVDLLQIRNWKAAVRATEKSYKTVCCKEQTSVWLSETKTLMKKIKPQRQAMWLTGITSCRTFATQPPTQWVEGTDTLNKQTERSVKAKRRLQQELGLKIWGILAPFPHRFPYCGADWLIFYLSRWTVRRLTGHCLLTQ